MNKIVFALIIVVCAAFAGVGIARVQNIPSHGGKAIRLNPLASVPAGMQAILCPTTTSASINLDKLTWKRAQPGPKLAALPGYPHCRLYTAPATGDWDMVTVTYRGAKAFTSFFVTHPVRP